MGWWKFGRRKSAWPGSKPVVRQERASGGILGFHAVRQLIHEALASYDPPEFYELELAEVMEVILTEDQLPELEDGSGKDWNAMGGVRARGIESQKDQLPVDTLIPIFPLDPNNSTVPIRGEMVILVNFKEKGFYISLLNFFNSPKTNLLPGQSGARDEEMRDEDFKYEHFDLEDYENIRRIWPYQGDNIYQGRWGQSIRFGSNIIPDSHEDGDSTQHSPNIIIRAGQLLDADAFDKGGIVEDLKNDITLRKTVKEDINADGSSIWMTTDQKVDIKLDNSHSTFIWAEKGPGGFGGNRITINSDGLILNSKKNNILMSSMGFIGLTANTEIGIEVPNDTGRVYLGDGMADQPVLGGDQTMELFGLLVDYLIEFTNQLAPAMGSIINFPVPIPHIPISCSSLVTKLQTLKTRIDEPKSKTVHVGHLRGPE